MKTRSEPVPFVSYLEQLRDDRAALASLRRALGKSSSAAVGAHRYVVPWLPQNSTLWQEEIHYLVAALFASHPEPGGEGSVGKTLARVAAQAGVASTERRFVALLNCHAEELGSHLRYAVSLAKSKGVPVNWHQLFRDLRNWPHPDGYVQRRWARDFWAGSETAGPKDAGQVQTN